MDIGDKVEKVGGDYTFEGVVVSKFEKLSGKVRYVVEDDRGCLHIYSRKNLRDKREQFVMDNITQLKSQRASLEQSNDRCYSDGTLKDMERAIRMAESELEELQSE